MSDDPVIETCRSCNGRAPLDESAYITEHDWGIMNEAYVAVPIGHGAYRCAGSGKRSLEWRDRTRQKKIDRHQHVVSQIRQDALVAYDAWCEGRPGFLYDAFLEIALKEHRLKFPGQVNERINRGKPYMTERIRGGGWKSYKIDVYCTFCRGLLVPAIGVAATPEAFAIVKTHPIGCALQCLAGVREMMPPEHYGLIDEQRALPDHH